MKREEIIKYILEHDEYYENVDFSEFTLSKLLLIKIRIEIDKAHENENVKVNSKLD